MKGNEEIRVRFGGIDTPERNQRHGREATEAHRNLVEGKSVRVELTGKRSGSRMIGELFVPGTNGQPDVDVSLELVRGGHAWWFWQFANENMARAGVLAAAEVEAKINRRGLFAADDPIYPRVFRRGARVPNEMVEDPADPTLDSEVCIVRLVPNPTGADADNEVIVMGNKTSLTVSIDGWLVRDDDGGQFQLSGQLDAGQEKTFVISNPDSLALGNNGDEVRLLDADGNVVQRFTYGNASAGEVITPGR